MVFSSLGLPLRQCPAIWDVELRFYTEYVVFVPELAISGGRLQVNLNGTSCFECQKNPSMKLDCG